MTGLRERKKRETRLRLATAAVELLLSDGVEGATVAAIAARAGVSTRTFHNYFAAREDAFLFFLELAFDRWEEQIKAAPAGDSAPAVLRRTLGELYDRPGTLVTAAPNLATVFEHTMVGVGPEGAHRIKGLFDGVRDALVERADGALSPFRALILIHMSLAIAGVVLDAVDDPELSGGRDVGALLDDAFGVAGYEP